uniref:DNA repair and recombination protein RAD54-like n=1 Tax=Caenorhabditis japonica TaxID=281687 RepID=A0A8R1HMT7_CAEJA
MIRKTGKAQESAKSGPNLVHSCLIVVPSSLVNNWKAEFDKWWRFMRFPAVIALQAKDISTYQSTAKSMPYLIVSYDMAQRHVEKLRSQKFDVIVCDEGHKLKNVDGKLRSALVSLQIPRRLILTGTPMQNDYDEFYSLLDFVCPEEFGTLGEFRRMCNENPEALNRKIDECMLRRTSADVNTSHMPEKHEYILFCAASKIQKRIHSEICEYMTGDALSLIFFARQLVNHPKLLYDNLREKHDKSNQKHSALLLAFDGETMPRGGVKESGKLTALVDMLKCFRLLGECAVIVSNYIETLDMIEQLCKFLEFNIFRLDGKTQVQDRQKAVRQFNDQRDASNVFLLSTKAGGVGLNLIGASRLVLFDSDWNPANDQQAMARIWRDGQVRPCHIYRLITTGTIEEKMLQRQIKKTGLRCVIDAIEVGDTISTFADEELKDIFTFIEATECNTHDLCECPCDGSGMMENEMAEEEDEEEEEDVENRKIQKGQQDSDDDEEVDDEELESEITLLEHDDEVVEDSADEKDEDDQEKDLKKHEEPIKTKKNAKTLGVASLAELSRWRHFSPRHQDTWRHFMINSGLSQVETDVQLTFAFYQQSQY